MRVVIIGSGLLGLVTAYFLREGGAEVCVLDRQDGAGRETSFANGGMLHASQATPWNAPGILWAALRMLGREDSALLMRTSALPRMLRWSYQFIRQSNPARYASNVERNARLANYSLEVMQQIRASHDLHYDYSPNGTLTIFRDERAFDDAARFAEQFAAGGIAFDMVDGTGALALEPALQPIASEIVGASYYPHDESGDAFKFCQALQQICAASGVEFHFGTRVTRLDHDRGLITAANTPERRFNADKFVLAAGSYTPILSKTAGLRVPVQPVKGYSITVSTDGWDSPPIMPVIDDGFHSAVCPLGDRIRVAGTAEFAGYNKILTKSRVDNLTNVLLTIYPEFKNYYNPITTDRWTGLRPMTPEGVGVMGSTRIQNLYLNTGHGHLGWTMAAGAGKAVAEEVLEGSSEFSLEDYRLK